MARITDNLVIQRVEDLLVILQEPSGVETTIPIDVGPRLTAMAAYLTNPEDPQQVLDQAADQLKQVGAIE